MSSGARVSIPNSSRKTIQNIKEVTGNHSDEEIYAMLKECSMDPNETVQKLLFQDPFHEVKRKRDRRKENLSNQEPAESRWRPGMQGRGSRGGRENYSIRNSSSDYFDTIGNQGSAPLRSGINQVSDKGVGFSTSPNQEMNIKEIGHAKSPLAAATKSPDGAVQSTDVLRCANISAASVVKQPEENKAVDKSKLGGAPALPQVNTKETPSTSEGESLRKLSTSSNSLNVGTSISSAGGYLSGSVLVSTHNSRLPCDVDTIKGEEESKQNLTKQVSVVSSEEMPTADPEVGSSSSHEEMLSRSVGVETKQLLDSTQSLSSTHNSSNQSPQVAGAQKVCISKECKPKSENLSLAQGSGIAGSSEIATAPEIESSSEPLLDLDSGEATFTLQRKVETLQTSVDQHVIIPNHLHVPEAERIAFCFGSFDVAFDLSTLGKSGPENERTEILPSETTGDVEETAEQFASNHEELTTTTEEDYPEESQSPKNVTQDVPLVEDVASSTAVPEYSESKPEIALPPGSNQQSPFQTSTGYSYGFVPAMMGSQLAPFDTSETQVRDVSRFPSFVGGNTLVFPTTGQAHLGSQAAGIMQNSMFVTQQPPSVLRQPTAMPLPHYAPNFIPYGHYFSPLYAPTSPIHQYVSNGAFSQQHQPGTLYPAPPGPAAKYSLPQYKAGIHPAAGNMTASEDLAASQFKESSIYITGQSEGVPIWIPAPGRDISALQASSLYNIPPQSQVTFAPTQIGHGTFAGIYHHPAQAVSAANIYPHLQQSQPLAAAVDLVRPAAIVYQQPQNAQINWPSNY